MINRGGRSRITRNCTGKTLLDWKMGGSCRHWLVVELKLHFEKVRVWDKGKEVTYTWDEE